MRGSSFIAVATLVGLLLASPVIGSDLRSDAYIDALRVGLDHLYRLDHESAIESFEALGERFPGHPGPPLAVAMSLWLAELFEREELDLDRFVSPGYFTEARAEPMDPVRRERLLERIDRAQSLAERFLESYPGDLGARYYLGACEAARAVFAFTVERSYREALGHGKKSYEINRAIVDESPEFGDSYLTVGTYEYVAGNLPWFIKWLAVIAGYRGSVEQGFEYLVKAAQDGLLVRDEARVMLMVLYVREGQNDYALKLARELHGRYPENFILHINRAQILERLGRKEESVDALLELVSLHEAGAPNYHRLAIERIRFPLAERLIALGRGDEALKQLDALAASEEASDADRARASLNAGELLERRGRANEASERYRAVLRLADVNGSHRSAKKRLEEVASHADAR